MTLDAQLDELFGARRSSESPGMSVAIGRDGESVWARGSGLADIGARTLLSPTTTFDVCSIAKSFVALTVACVLADGELALEDPLGAYVPELPQCMEGITVRHLLSNTSGIRDYGMLSYLGARSPEKLGPDDVLKLLGRQRELNFPPGTDLLYSHSDYFLLTIILERITGTPFAHLCARRVLDPLGMRQTSFFPQDAPSARGHRNVSGRFETACPVWRIPGNGGMISTVEDLARWDRCLVEDVLGPAANFVSTGISRPGPLRDGGRPRYALGLVLSGGENPSTCGNGGSWDGYSSAFLHFLQERVTIVVLANLQSTDAFALAGEVADLVFAQTTDRTSGQVAWQRLRGGPTVDGARGISEMRDGGFPETSRKFPERSAGTYYSEELAVFYSLHPGSVDRIVAHRGDDAVILDTTGFRMEFVGGAGSPRGFSLSTGKARRIFFARLTGAT